MSKLLFFPDQGSILSFKQESEIAFIAILGSDFTYESLQMISPNVMQWNDQIWIVDLRSCLSYWSAQGKKTNTSVFEYIRGICDRIGGKSGYYASVASDPWQSILLLGVLEEKGMHGFISLQSNMGRNLYTYLSWQVWQRCVTCLIQFLYTNNLIRRSKLIQYEQKLSHMLRSIKKLGINFPSEISDMPAYQIRRRFGRWMESVWKRTYQTKYHQPDCDLDEHEEIMPWVAYRAKIVPVVTRYLDFPLKQWDQIEDYLKQDLHKLSFLDSFKNTHRIISLEWLVVLQNLDEVPLTIFFRHPYNLRKEPPHFRTALLQIFFQYESYQLKIASDQNDEILQETAIIGWQLKITQTLEISNIGHQLFDDSNDLDALIALENRLQVPLYSYQHYDSWVPEESFVIKNTREYSAEINPSTEGQYSFKQASTKHHPLYIYPYPQKFQSDTKSGVWRFVERVMDSWWKQPSPNTFRDYYQYINLEKNLWLYQDSSGQWYTHGIFA